MSLRRLFMLSIFYIYRRISISTRSARYWLLIIIIAMMYLLIYICIQDKTTLSSSNIYSGNDQLEHEISHTKEHSNRHENLPIEKQSASLLVNDKKIPVIIPHQTRLRYSFIDIDHLKVNIDVLDEIYQPPKDLRINLPSPNSHPLSRILNVKGDLSTIIYNRIPHCYEFTMGLLLRQVSYLHSYTYISSKIYTPFSYNHSALISITRSLMNHTFNRLLYERHIYFFDSYHLQFPTHPVWINLVRDPIYRIAADFNQSREVCRRTDRCFVTKKSIIDDTLDTCVLNHSPRLCISPASGVSRMILFFCGLTHPVRCEDDSGFALQQAKQNIDFFYTVVGIAEEFYKFLYVLEKLFPQYFKLARLIYMNTRNPKQLVDERDVNIQLPNNKTIAILKPLLADEYELYRYIKQRFFEQFKILTDLN